MMTYRPPNFKKLPDLNEDLPAFAEAYAIRIRDFYDSRAQWHRRFYRFSGVMVILPHKTFVVSAVGVLVAALTGLRAFYRWEQGWVVLRQTEFAINEAYWAYKGGTPQPDDKAASDLLLKLMKIRENEAEAFFKDLTFPHPGK